MGLETVVNIADLVITNPTGSDPKSQGDDHLRNLKIALRNDFAGFLGAVLVTGTDGGAANTYTLTPTTALPAYTSKMLVEFTPNATNTAAVTLNISALGAIPVVSQAGVAMAAGDLVSGRCYLVGYDGSSFRLIAVTTAYVDAVRDYASSLAFTAALPSQAGNAGKVVTTDGTTASWAYRGLVLLATLTPTAAAAVNALTTFSSTFDSYLVIGVGICPATDDVLVCGLANAGTLDTTTKYANQFASTTGPFGVGGTSIQCAGGGVQLAAGIGCNFTIQINNANDAVNIKTLSTNGVSAISSTPTFVASYSTALYVGTNTVSGIGFKWSSGANFKAQGSIRIFGIQKA
jgi:hypothetical protein